MQRTNYLNKVLCIVVITIVLVSCKTRDVAAGNGSIKRLSVKEIIKKHDKNKSDFTTLIAKLKVRYKDPDQSQNISVSMRIAKDEKIWISASLIIPLAKVLITPEKISYYNKIDRTYFEGDFSLLSNWLGTELNFEQIQSLLLGESLYDFNKEKHSATIYDTSYLLQPKKQLELFERLFLVNSRHFKLDAQELSQEKEGRILEVKYREYQEIEHLTLPKRIELTAVDKQEERSLNIDYRTIYLNQKLKFPFKIPGHYTEITF